MRTHKYDQLDERDEGVARSCDNETKPTQKESLTAMRMQVRERHEQMVRSVIAACLRHIDIIRSEQARIDNEYVRQLQTLSEGTDEVSFTSPGLVIGLGTDTPCEGPRPEGARP